MKTAEDIVSRWATTDGDPERLCLRDLIVFIYNKIPNDKSEELLMLTQILENLWYKTPTNAINTWNDIYKFLQNNFSPLSDNSPQWLVNIEQEWKNVNKRCAERFMN